MPPQTKDNNWRLTPDTIREWMEIELDKQAEAREREHSREKAKKVDTQEQEPLSPDTDEMISKYLASLSGLREVQALTDQDIKKYGKERIKKPSMSAGMAFTSREDLTMHKLRKEWAMAVHDLHTGHRLDNWISFEEWILK